MAWRIIIIYTMSITILWLPTTTSVVWVSTRNDNLEIFIFFSFHRDKYCLVTVMVVTGNDRSSERSGLVMICIAIIIITCVYYYIILPTEARRQDVQLLLDRMAHFVYLRETGVDDFLFL